MLLHTVAIGSSAFLQTLGRLHVAAVHLPIGLLLVAGIIELWRAIRRQPGGSPVSLTCLIFGGIGAGVAAVLGWIHAKFTPFAGDEARICERHEWLGFATAIAALVTLVLLLALKNRRGGQVWVYRLGAVACAVLVAMSGHLGGELTHGEGYLTELLTSPSRNAKPHATTAPVVTVVHFPADGKVVFARDVQPIFAQSCYECHSVSKTRGGLRLDSAAGIFKGGNSGTVILAHDSASSLLVQRVRGELGKKRMPVDHDPLPEEQVKILATWIDQGAGGAKDASPVKQYVAPLEPRVVKVPDATAEITNPIDRILEPYFQAHKILPKKVVDDRVFARRVYLDVIGLLPTAQQLQSFISDTRANKREALVEQLLADNQNYAENFLTFWNDALRNDYRGPGYIDGGRKQILAWLYTALETNKPYDQFVRELLDPSPASEGFIKGIIWRGAVSASQGREIQAAQNITQVFLGLNFKCNSCHDSFISDWKLIDAYGLAGVYADKPMEVFRCEKTTGQVAPIKFIWPQLGTINSNAPKAQRIKQLAQIMTSPKNGRLTRTICNRLWARFLGRGLVEPLDEMDHEPWDADLLDWLAVDLGENHYDLKHTIATILTSRAYQLPAVGSDEISQGDFVFSGPLVRRLMAEQFVDALSQITDVWQGQPASTEAMTLSRFRPSGKWIWNVPGAATAAPPAKIYFRKIIDLPATPSEGIAAITADNHFVLFINGKKVDHGDDFTKPQTVDLTKYLASGKNVLSVTAINDWLPAKGQPTTSPANPAGLWVQATARIGHTTIDFSSDASWQWATSDDETAEWKPAVELGDYSVGPWQLPVHMATVRRVVTLNTNGTRAVWANADALMTALGRPNRERPVTYRPSVATMLQALELTNGAEITGIIQKGATDWLSRKFDSPTAMVKELYIESLGREPAPQELQQAEELIGSPARQEGLEDLIWSLVMLPEFQLIY